jgi:hypothetical protein
MKVYKRKTVNLDGSVGIATGYGLDGRGSSPGRDKRFFCSLQRPDRTGAHGFLGVKRPGREADSSPLSTNEMKKC